MYTLDLVPPGGRVRIVDLRGGRELVSRLMQMGLHPGAIVEVVENSKGPVLVRVRGVVIALGRGLARKIVVMPLR